MMERIDTGCKNERKEKKKMHTSTKSSRKKAMDADVNCDVLHTSL